jgi:hypothetical protein
MSLRDQVRKMIGSDEELNPQEVTQSKYVSSVLVVQ